MERAISSCTSNSQIVSMGCRLWCFMTQISTDFVFILIRWCWWYDYWYYQNWELIRNTVKTNHGLPSLSLEWLLSPIMCQMKWTCKTLMVFWWFSKTYICKANDRFKNFWEFQWLWLIYLELFRVYIKIIWISYVFFFLLWIVASTLNCHKSQVVQVSSL